MRPLIFILALLVLLGLSAPVAAQPLADSDPVPETPTATVTETALPATPTDTVTAIPPTATPSPSATWTVTPSASALPPSATASVTVTPLPLDPYEPDNVPQQAHRLVVGEVQQRTFYSPGADDVDWAILYLKVGRWRISARTATGIYDPKLTLGALVVDDTGDSKDAIMEVEIAAEQDYLLRVDNVGVDGPGQYTLSLERVGDPLTPTATATGAPGPGTEDPFENDTPPHQPGYTGPQLRTFNPANDVDYVRYRLKGGLTVWVETLDLTGGADTELLVYRDEDGVLTGADPLLEHDDDRGPGLGSRVTLDEAADQWLTIVVVNKAAAWGPATSYTLRIVTAEQATPTASPPAGPTSVPAPPERPTYTPYPTYTVVPSATATPQGPQATYTPYPTYTAVPMMPANPPGPGGTSGGTGTSGGDQDPGGQGGAADGEPAPLPPTPAPGVLHLQVFVDTNRNGVMDWGEEAEGVLVYATTRDRRWEAEAYTSRGEAVLSLTGLPDGEEMVLLVPYLHRAATLTQKGVRVQSDVMLDLPQLPLYLP